MNRPQEVVGALKERGLPVFGWELFDHANALGVGFNLPDGTRWAARCPLKAATPDWFEARYRERVA